MERTSFSGTVLHAKKNADKNVSPKEFINKLLKKVTCGIWQWWILGLSCELLPLVFSSDPLLPEDTVDQSKNMKAFTVQ